MKLFLTRYIRGWTVQDAVAEHDRRAVAVGWVCRGRGRAALPALYHFMVAGHSSGGKMASDHFVAYSDVVTGLGQLESGAYARDRVPQNTTVRACAFAASPCPTPPAPARRVCGGRC